MFSVITDPTTWFPGDTTLWGAIEYAIIGIGVILLVLILVALFKKPKSKFREENKPSTNVYASSPTPEKVVPEPAAPKKEEVPKKEEPKPKQQPKKASPAPVAPVEDEKPAALGRYHVTLNRDDKGPNANKWRVRREGSRKTIKFFDTQKEAIEYAYELAENQDTSVVIHKRDGSIRKQDYSKKK